MKKIISVAGLCFVLASCGFQPMYGGYSDASGQEQYVRSQLTQIHIENIPDREGQFLRNALIDRFYRDARASDPLYRLKISSITESIVDLDITKESDTTRSQLRVTTSMNLIDTQTGESVLGRKLSAISSFNVLGSEFATRVSEKNTRENALNELARQIELQIGLYLRRQ
ncbi:MAG: LPS assembly lipoprotein LptE [Alphaproteobacteria bacterium]